MTDQTVRHAADLAPDDYKDDTPEPFVSSSTVYIANNP